MLQGLISDIHRFSLEDGPGIRTTIFMKGCPLSCVWCHNPETHSTQPQLRFRQAQCQDCLECVKVCPSGAHAHVEQHHFAAFDACDLNGACVSACPNRALSIVGKYWSAPDIIQVILKDRSYYESSSGGVTLSGGEPLMQIHFIRELLEAIKGENIHTCLDTSGHAPTEHLDQIMDFVDLYYFDYKATGLENHRKLTGVRNKVILENLEYLLRNEQQVILRCPLIPGINDDDKHLDAILSLAQKYPELKGVHVLPYHSFGRSKWRDLGMEVPISLPASTTEGDLSRWHKLLSHEINIPIQII
ncbi:MAG: glycyl-radical enzyme activating protein [Candidatus Marinimicrobia bacterium]|nr:glycyl-radical enzyme activating protein [Candidatus Neomarinimicrobiota bacterium]MCF7850905.1 glycyl-radical enzyme activating protein [Candidatus Neomarinimicrobiota bacterium]MCF7905127.1 glycyl-radical enzyme activating protein [Candidatus Neomarinimicrobiota bacterium]